MQVYMPAHFADFKLTNEFEKWACVEVTDFDHVPSDMETFNLAEGLYAVFDYKGLSSDPSIFQYIFGTWLPSSEYILDNRPHFEILGDKYKNNDLNSEEEIWVPIKLKNNSSGLKEHLKGKFEDRFEDLGIFNYSEKGFTVNLDNSNYEIKWDQIQTIFGYKIDLLTIDEICLDIFCDQHISFMISEETAGWFVFLEHLKERFSTIRADWNFIIQMPAFQTNLTLIYDRENRDAEQLKEAYY
jgi:hypothetical protein